MPTRMTIGVSNTAGVTFSSERMAELIKPVCSATPIPSIATSTTPTGWKCEKFVTMTDRNSVIAEPASRLLMTNGAPVRGSTTSKLTKDSRKDSTQTMNSSAIKSTAGSGSLLPIRSTAASMPVGVLFAACFSAMR